MAQNEKSHNPVAFFGDIALTAVAVSIVALTFYGVSGLTPQVTSKVASNNAAVLGVSTKQAALSYFPAQTATVPFIKNYLLSGNTSLNGNALLEVTFTPLEASTYEFTAVTIKNTTLEFRKIQLNPSFSLDGSYTTISMKFDGQTTQIISAQGLVTPLDLVIAPSSSADVKIIVQPSIKIATPATLSLGFTEVP